MITDIKKQNNDNIVDIKQNLAPKEKNLNSPKKKFSFWLQDFVLILILIALSIFILIPSLIKKDEMAPGADIISHVYIAKYLTDYIEENRKLPAVNPYWYAGWEPYHNTPKIMPILIGLGYFLSGNIIKVSQIAQVLVIIFAALLMYSVIRKKHSSLSAFLGAILFVFSPAFLMDIIYLGSYPRSTAMALSPILFYFIEKIINREKVFLNISFSALTLLASILLHPLIGSAFILFFSIYFLLRIFGARKYPHIKFTNLILWTIILILAIGTSIFYLAPIFLEKGGWYKLPESVPYLHSIPPQQLISLIDIPLLMFLIIFLFKKGKARGSWPLFITGIISALFSLGVYTPFYGILAFTNVYPFIGSIFATFCFSYVIAVNLEIKWKPRPKTRNFVLILLLIFSIIYLAWQAFSQTREIKISQTKLFDQNTMEITEKLKKYENPGRLIPMQYPFDVLLWWLPTHSKSSAFEGWYYSTTLQGKHIAWLYDALNYGFPEYLLKRFRQLNVRYFLINNFYYTYQVDSKIKFIERIQEKGFRKVETVENNQVKFPSPDNQSFSNPDIFSESSFVLFLKDEASSFFMPIKEKILVIGRHAMPANAVLENAIQGQSIFIDEYDPDLLKNFDTIVLIGFSFRNKEKAESLIKELALLGKKIVIDMNDSIGSRLEENLNFLGVSSNKEIYKNAVILNKNGEISDEITSLPASFEIPEEFNGKFNSFDPESEKNPRKIKLKEWRFSSYSGLDKIYARLENERDNSFGLIGYREIEKNKVWFIGPNIFYHAYLTQNPDELNFLEKLASNNNGKEVPEIAIDEKNLDPEGGYLKFFFSSPESFLGLVSFTYSPHWKAYLDGKEVKINNLEDLMVLNLPEGSHVLELYYKNIFLHTIAWFVSIVFLIIILILIIIGFFHKKSLKNENANY